MEFGVWGFRVFRFFFFVGLGSSVGSVLAGTLVDNVQRERRDNVGKAEPGQGSPVLGFGV